MFREVVWLYAAVKLQKRVSLSILAFREIIAAERSSEPLGLYVISI